MTADDEEEPVEDGVALGGDVVVSCTYWVRPAARTCAGCGLPICDAHVAPDMPMFCIQCARGHSHRAEPSLPDTDFERQFARDLDKVKE